MFGSVIAGVESVCLAMWGVIDSTPGLHRPGRMASGSEGSTQTSTVRPTV